MFFLSFSFFLNQEILQSQTVITGGNVSGYWTSGGSPYLIEGDIAISESDSLIIDPGVEIIFQDYFLFQIFGKLTAVGTEADSILFTCSSNNGWGGLDFSDCYSSKIKYCIVELSNAAGITIYYDDPNKYVELTNSIIRNNISHGIYLITGGLKLNNVVITQNGGDGINNCFMPLLEMSNVVVSDNAGDGIDIDELSGYMDNIKILNNNGSGIYEYSGGYCEMKNLEVKNNLGYGIYLWFGTPDISNFTISGNGLRGIFLGDHANCSYGNVSNNGEGGVFLQYESWPTLSNITIEGNGPTSEGGGLYIEGGCWLNNLIVKNNIAQNGGGVFANSMGYEYMIMDSCYVENNNAIENGGGIFINIDSDGNFISNSKISNNTAFNGAGLFISGIPYHGDNLNNLVIDNNSATNAGGGLYAQYADNLQMNKLSIINNTAQNYAGGLLIKSNSDTIISNSIIWGNNPPEIIDSTGFLQITYSDIEGGWPGTGNIDADPLFKDVANTDFHLSWANYPLEDYTKSPCIDSGDPSMTDPDNSVIDMGAYSFDRDYQNQFLPGIISIDDVPNDQGKSIVLNWTRSILDAPDSGTITEYKIFRKQDWTKEPWELVGTVDAHHFEEYAFVAPTIIDSTSQGIHFHTFIVSAETDDPDEYYFSYPDSGYSVDNLNPLQPNGVYGYIESNYIKLLWNKASDEDFSHFAIYKSEDNPDFPEEPFMVLSDTVFSDTAIFADTIYYTITSFDFNGNESLHSDTLMFIPGKVFDIKVYLEGPFYYSQMIPYLNLAGYLPLSQPYNKPPWNYYGGESVTEIPGTNIIDWVLLDFRNAVDAETAANSPSLKRIAVFIKEDGTIVGIDGISPPRVNLTFNNNLFLVIFHRNHLSIMNSAALQEDAGTFTYDFTTGSDKYFGGVHNCIDVGNNLWGMISSDANDDGQIDNKDKDEVWIFQNGNSGYLTADFNMDGDVNPLDIDDYWSKNAGFGNSISGPTWVCGEALFDERDGQLYNTALISDQCWLSENLNIGILINGNNNQADNQIIEKYCIDNNPQNCNDYGGLYQWNEMMQYVTSNGAQGICPEDWHLPSISEWDDLELFLGGSQIAGGKMKERGTTHWNTPNTGATNSSNFTGLPGGYRSLTNGGFFSYGYTGFFWTSTVSSEIKANARFLHYNNTELSDGTSKKLNGFSVRCIKN